MKRPHDMGGDQTDTPVRSEPLEHADGVFDQPWHADALALTLACGALGQWNLDISRHARECLAPEDYRTFTYYEKWIAALADLLVERGVISQMELSGETPPTQSDLSSRALKPSQVADVLSRGGPTNRDTDTSPAFSIDDSVLTRDAGNKLVAGGHTRLPSYAAQKIGRIVAHHGAHVFPDAHAHGLGEMPQHLYSVAFKAIDLWPDVANSEDKVILDLWEPYLGVPV